MFLRYRTCSLGRSRRRRSSGGKPPASLMPMRLGSATARLASVFAAISVILHTVRCSARGPRILLQAHLRPAAAQLTDSEKYMLRAATYRRATGADAQPVSCTPAGRPSVEQSHKPLQGARLAHGREELLPRAQVAGHCCCALCYHLAAAAAVSACAQAEDWGGVKAAVHACAYPALVLTHELANEQPSLKAAPLVTSSCRL